MKSIVFICGTNKQTRSLVDWSLEYTADYWVFNESAYVGDREDNRWTAGKPISAVFQMHMPQIWRSDNGGHYPGYYNWLKEQHPFPIYMQDIYEDVPSSKKYPLEPISGYYLLNLQRGHKSFENFFTSSAAFAIALAIHLHYTEIHLCGVEMASGTEYARQRDCVSFWLGIAVGRGIKVVLLEESDLFQSKLYGYTGEVVIQRQMFELASTQMSMELKRLETMMFEAQGAVKATMNALSATKSQKDAGRLQQLFFEQLNTAQEAVFAYGVMAGKLAENNRYLAECDELIAASGGKQAAEVLEMAA